MGGLDDEREKETEDAIKKQQLTFHKLLQSVFFYTLLPRCGSSSLVPRAPSPSSVLYLHLYIYHPALLPPPSLHCLRLVQYLTCWR